LSLLRGLAKPGIAMTPHQGVLGRRNATAPKRDIVVAFIGIVAVEVFVIVVAVVIVVEETTVATINHPPYHPVMGLRTF